VNVPAAHLKSYESRLKEAVNLYKQRPEFIVMSRLSVEQRAEVDTMSTSDRAAYFDVVMKQSSDVDVSLLVQEIQVADSYDEMSKALRAAYVVKRQEIVADNALKASRKLGILPAQRNKKKLFSVGATCKIVTPLFNVDPTNDHANYAESSDATVPAFIPARDILVANQQVLARWDPDGYYYPARLAQKNESGFIVLFEDGDRQHCNQNSVVPIPATPQPLKPGRDGKLFL
jgi:hypothetical protein